MAVNLPLTRNPHRNLSIRDQGMTERMEGQDLRNFLPARKVLKETTYENRAALEMADALAKQAQASETTSIQAAKNIRDKLCQLSGVPIDQHVIDFIPQLADAKYADGETYQQVVYLKPIVSGNQPKDLQAPVIFWGGLMGGQNSIMIARPSLNDPERFLITTIPQIKTFKSNDLSRITELINLVDENKLPSNVRFVAQAEINRYTCQSATRAMNKPLI